MEPTVQSLIADLMEALNKDLNLVIGDFIVSERMSPEKYLSLLDEGEFEWEHPSEPWKIEFTKEHMVKATYTPGLPDSYKWYSILNRSIIIDISEMVEDQVGA